MCVYSKSFIHNQIPLRRDARNFLLHFIANLFLVSTLIDDVRICFGLLLGIFVLIPRLSICMLNLDVSHTEKGKSVKSL